MLAVRVELAAKRTEGGRSVSWCMAFLGAGAGLVIGAITPAMTVLGAKASPPALGAAFAVFNLAYATGLFVGPTLGGIVTDRASFAPAMLVLAATVLLVGVLAARRLARFGELCSSTSATDAPRSGSRLDDVGE